MKMRKVLSVFLSMAMITAVAAGCGSETEETTAAATTAAATEAADTTAAETEAADTTAAETEAAGGELSGAVSTNGSTSMEDVIGSLAEQFMLDNPGVTVSYDPTGSGTGIEAASQGTADIGLSSRALKDEETASGLVGTTVALDGIAIIVNAENPVTDLTVEQIASIFTGEVTDWADLGGEAGTIATIGREAGSGTRDGFESITGTEDTCVLNQELTSTGAVIEAVRGNASAIGYASLSAVEGQEGIVAITVGGVACTEETVADGTYAIQRPFVLVTKDGAELSPQAQAFFDFATSADAAELIRNAGAVPVAE